jgi:nitroimidazol reductase NimA-like FMN-containing flavoprotein (pyridoxamine 5'-phosphate oxidase superfamily)
MPNAPNLTATERTTIHRKPSRGSYDRALAYSILDEALHCSVGFVAEAQPFVIPMAFARWDDRIILHGAPASRLLKIGSGGVPVCVSVTLVDGLVLARSAMHHSLNYRSVVVLGTLTELTSIDEKEQALLRVVEHVLRGRSKVARPPNARELAATRVLALPIDEASVKQRTGGPIDDEADLSYPCWAGVLPLSVVAGQAVPDDAHPPFGAPPPELATYARKQGDHT